jgi:hypothetical protein
MVDMVMLRDYFQNRVRSSGLGQKAFVKDNMCPSAYTHTIALLERDGHYLNNPAFGLVYFLCIRKIHLFKDNVDPSNW